jgi:hypothetical protein
LFQFKNTSLDTSGRADPISSKVSKSQNFTVLSAEPEKLFAGYDNIIVEHLKLKHADWWGQRK